MSIKKLTVMVVLLFLLGLLLWKGLSLHPRRMDSTLVGKPVPVFSGKLLQPPGASVSQAVFKGRISILNVFASWCLSCRYEHPFWMQLAQNKKIRLLGLNYKDKRSDALAWLQKVGNPYSVIIDDPRGSIALDWGVYGSPESFLIDQQGIVRARYVGRVTRQVWGKKFQPIIDMLLARAKKG